MASRRIRVGCDFTYVAEIETPVIFQVQPGESPNVDLQREQWLSEPPMVIHGYADLYGNSCVRGVLPAAGRASATTRSLSCPMPRKTPTPAPRSARPARCPTTP
jgi:hypothetical protein